MIKFIASTDLGSDSPQAYSIAVYDETGRLVATLGRLDGYTPPGQIDVESVEPKPVESEPNIIFQHDYGDFRVLKDEKTLLFGVKTTESLWDPDGYCEEYDYYATHELPLEDAVKLRDALIKALPCSS